MACDNRFLLDMEWVEKIYQFSYKRTRNTDDAQDLSQEIIAQVLHAINRGTEPNNFHAWVWSIARNHWYKYLDNKQRETRLLRVEGGQITPYTLDSQVCLEQEVIDQETISELNKAISHLSAMHRQMIILYYLQEKSIAQIATALSIPEGTVKRRLFDARTKIKEGMENMKSAASRASYAPTHVELFGGYSAPNHWQYLKSTLVRNILAASYKEPVSLEYLAKELGVASVYLEEELVELVQRGLMKRQGKKYVTNFIMFPQQTWLDFRVEVAEAWEGLASEMVKNLSSIKGTIVDQLFHGKNFEWNYLLWILLVFACDSFSVIAQKNYARKWEGKDLVKHELDYRISGLIKYADEELSQPDPAKIKYVNWSNLHNYFENVAGYRGVEYANLYQHDPFPNRDEWIHAGNIGLLVRLAQQPKSCLSEAEQEQAAMLIKRGLLKKHEGGLSPTIPMIETAQWRYVNELILEAIHPCIDEAVEQVATLADSMLLPEVRKDLWEHYVNWIMMLCLNPLNYVLYQGREEGLLQLPKEYNQATHGLYLRLY